MFGKLVPGLNLDPTAIALSLLFGGIGFVAFRYGRKTQEVPPIVLGAALMTYPMLVNGVDIARCNLFHDYVFGGIAVRHESGG